MDNKMRSTYGMGLWGYDIDGNVEIDIHCEQQ